MLSSSAREYDLILFGATGYTGKLCAEYITLELPGDLNWAVAGRSAAKLSAIVNELKSINSDRRQPGIETAALNPEDLASLVKKTRVLINTVGPYHLYGSPVVEACAKNGTHYLDVTGETPWVLDMIKKHHETAKANHAIIIPEIGIEAAPSDLVTWSLANLVRNKLSVGLKEVISSSEMKAAPSGGTLATLMELPDHYSVKDMKNSMRPWALSPIPGSKPEKSSSWVSKIFGFRSVPKLGIVTTSMFASTNESIVQRSWGLQDNGKFYGSKFSYTEYQKADNRASGAAAHFFILFVLFALSIKPVRWLVKKFVYAPGQGPVKESTKNELLDVRTIATADQGGRTTKRAFGRFRYEGGMYYLTGLLLAEAAMILLQNDDLTKKLGGGLLTPAMLGQSFIDRLRNAGVLFEAEMLPDE